MNFYFKKMNNKDEISLRERLLNLKNKVKNENINNFTMLTRLPNNNNKNRKIKYKSFSQLKSKIIEKKHLNNRQKNLKNQRLNEIFDKDKFYDSKTFIKKFREVFNETYNNNSTSYNYVRNNTMNNQSNSKLINYINKIKKMNDKNLFDNNNNSNDKNYSMNLSKNISERKYDNNDLINKYCSTFFEINKSTSYNKLKKNNIVNGNIYKNINHKIRFNDNNKKVKINGQCNPYGNLFRNNKYTNKYNNNYEKTFNSMDYYQSVLSTTNSKLSGNNNLFSIRKNIIDKKLDFYKGNNNFY